MDLALVSDPTAGLHDLLDQLEADLTAAEHLLHDAHPVAAAGPPTAIPVDLPRPRTVSLDGGDAQVEALLARMRALHARQSAVISRLATAMVANRQHRELLSRAAAPHDRPVFVDRRA